MNVDKTVVSAKGSKFPIKGYAKPGFEPVVDAFCHNFAIDKELGSSCCTYRRWQVPLSRPAHLNASGVSSQTTEKSSWTSSEDGKTRQ